MIILHVEIVDLIGKRDCIMILGAGSINKKSLLYSQKPAVLIEILYAGGLGVWRDLVTKLRSENVLLSLASRNIVEDRLLRYCSVM